MLPAEPDEERPLEVSGSYESLKDAVAVGLSFEADRQIAGSNTRRPAPDLCAIGPLSHVRELDDDAARREVSERAVRGDAVGAVAVANGRSPPRRLHTAAPADVGTSVRRTGGSDVPARRRAELRRRRRRARGREARTCLLYGRRRARGPPARVPRPAPRPRRAGSIRASAADTSCACRAERACSAGRPTG